MRKTANKSRCKREGNLKKSQSNAGHERCWCGTSAAAAVATTAHHDEFAFSPIKYN